MRIIAYFAACLSVKSTTNEQEIFCSLFEIKQEEAAKECKLNL